MQTGNQQSTNQPSQFSPNFLGGIGDLLAAFGLSKNNFQNPANSAMPYLNQLTNSLPGYYNPYINAGMGALPSLQQQFGQLVNNPGGKLNDIGQGFHQSPGFNFQVDQALGAANRAAAAGGMLGTPMEQQNVAGTVNNLANQDYYNWLGHATGLYSQGLTGMGDLYHTGFNASNDLANQMSQALATQAQLAYSGQNAQSQAQQGQQGGIWGLLSGGLNQIGSSLPSMASLAAMF